jgi:hypothetical protein
LLLDEPATAYRLLFLIWPLNPFGVGTIVHFEPFQCSARVRNFATVFGSNLAPTSQISRAEITVRPDTSVPEGLGRYRHLVPSQLIKTGNCRPPALIASPRAQAAVGEIAETADRPPVV